MNRHLLILGALILGTYQLRAEVLMPPPLSDSLLCVEPVRLNYSRVPDGILSDVGVSLIDFESFDGTSLTNNNYVNYETFSGLLNGLSSSNVSGNYTFPTNLEEQMSQVVSNQNYNPVGILVYKYSKVKEYAVAQNLITVNDENQFEDNYTSGGEWINPYESEYLVAFSPFVNIVGTTVTYLFSPTYRYTNLNIQSIQFNAGDGGGLRNVSLSSSSAFTISYSANSAPIEIVLRITLTDNTVLQTHSRIIPYSGAGNSSNSNSYIYEDFTSHGIYSGFQPSAKVSVKYANGSYLTKPIIIAEGFDPFSDALGLISNGVPGLGALSLPHIESDLPTQYDYVYIDWLDSCAPIEANADILKQVIEWVNNHKVGNEKNILIGQSMGGLIARYALLNMEDEHIPHQVKTYISHDAPHLGVNVPLGYVYAAQHLFDYLREGLLLTSTLYLLAQSSTSGTVSLQDVLVYKDELLAIRNAPSVQQMLLYYVDDSFQINRTRYLNLQSFFNMHGFPVGDNGNDIINLCLSNGGINDYVSPVQPLFSFSGEVSSGLLTDWLLWPLNVGYFGFLGIFPGVSCLSLNASVYPFTSSGRKVMDAECIYTKKHGLLKDQTHTFFSYEHHAPVSNFYPDKAYGSYYNLPNDLNTTQSGGGVWLGSYALDVSMNDKFMFVPTISSLCYKGTRSGLTDDNGSIDFANTGLDFSDIPFDGYKFWGDTATNHVNSRSTDFIWSIHASNYSITPPPTFLMDNYVFTITEEVTGLTPYSVTWSISDASVASINATTGRFESRLGGDATIFADVDFDEGHLRIKQDISLPVITFPGFPTYSLKSIPEPSFNGSVPTQYTITARPSSSVSSVFSSNFIYHWGYKENTNSPIVWTTSMSRDFFVNIPTTATSRRVYFYVEFNGQVSPTYSVLCKIPPIPAFILVDDSGKLYTEDMDTPFAEVKSDTFGETYLFSCLGHELVFDHFPTWSEFCAEMLMSEDFVNTVKMLKPWGEKEQIMIPYSYTENGDTFEDYLTLIYEKNNIFAEESVNE